MRWVSLALLATAACSLLPFPQAGEAEAEGPELVVSSDIDTLSVPASFHCTPQNGLIGSCDDVLGFGAGGEVLSVGAGGVRVESPAGWTFQAWLDPDLEGCNPGWELEVKDGVLDQLATAGDHDLALRGSNGVEQAVWSFSVDSESDHPLPEPFARLHWAPGGGNVPALTPFWVLFGNLTADPLDARGSVRVTSATGNSVEFDLIPIQQEPCGGAGVTMEAPMSFTTEVAELGSSPFELAVSLRREGGVTTFGPLIWPDDFPRGSDDGVRASPAPEATR